MRAAALPCEAERGRADDQHEAGAKEQAPMTFHAPIVRPSARRPLGNKGLLRAA